MALQWCLGEAVEGRLQGYRATPNTHDVNNKRCASDVERQTLPRVRSKVKVQIDASFRKDLAWNKGSGGHGLFCTAYT